MMQKSLVFSALTSVLLLGATPVSAETYARVMAGWSTTQDQDFSTTAGSVDTELDNGYALGGAVGYDYGELRAEVELSYRDSDVDSHQLNNAATTSPGGSVSALALMANGYYDFETNTKLTPYVGAGVGVARVDADGYSANGAAVADGNDTVFAYQVIAGLEYPVAPSTSVTGEYRYFATGSADIDTTLGGAGSSSVDYDNHSVLIGIKHSFDSGM